MNEAMNNLMTRRSVRKFKPDMIPEDVLNRIVKAGTYAPNGYGNLNLLSYVFYLFKFSKAVGLFSRIARVIWQLSNSEQSPQVENPFFKAHFRISHIRSQNTVFTPLIRQPSQLICSGRIGALFSSAHSFAVFSRKA